MLKAIIIEDEPQAVELLSHLCNSYCNIEILGTASHIHDGIELIARSKCDLLFLDISLSDGSGFDILNATEAFEGGIIFTTAHQQYSIQAIRNNAFDYLLKPIDVSELIAAVDRFRLKMSSFSKNPAILNTTETITKLILSRLKLNDGKNIRYLVPDEVIRFQANGRYTDVFLTNGKGFRMTRNLGDIEEELKAFQFIRIHKSHIVNPVHIQMFEKKDGNQLVLSDNSRVAISRRKREWVMQFLR